MDKTFWIHQPSVLVEDVSNYIPHKEMTDIEKLNSITLFCIIITIIMVCFKFVRLALLPLIVIIVIILIYENNKDNFEVIDDDFDKIKRIDEIRFKKDKDIIKEEMNSEIGYYDSDGVLRFDRTTNKIHKDNMPTSYNLNYECRRPTKDNPFMNIQLHDFDDEQQVEACNAEDDEINKDMVHSFNSKLFMNIDDAFERTNSQRQFFTTPNTRIPNNQIEFANWLYKTPETCKENNEQCLRYDDIRYNINRI